MTEAVKLLCEKVFAETDILRIYAEPFAYNIGSRHVLETAGFQRKRTSTARLIYGLKLKSEFLEN